MEAFGFFRQCGTVFYLVRYGAVRCIHLVTPFNLSTQYTVTCQWCQVEAIYRLHLLHLVNGKFHYHHKIVFTIVQSSLTLYRKLIRAMLTVRRS